MIRSFLPPRGVLLLALLAVSGARAEPDSIGEPATKWETSKLRICWATPKDRLGPDFAAWTNENVRVRPASSVRRETVRRILLANYPRSLTGISLTGFGDCDRGPERADLVLVNGILLSSFAADSLSGISSIGDPAKACMNDRTYRKAAMGLNHVEPKARENAAMKDYFDVLGRLLDPRSREALEREASNRLEDYELDRFRYVVVHEFGHALGLRHEELRAEAATMRKKYDFCASWAMDGGTELSINPDGKTSTFGTSYDLFSIMSYCRMDMIRLYHQTKLACSYRDSLRRSPDLSPAMTAVLGSLLEKCDFVARHAFPLGISAGDRIGLASLYGTPAPGRAVDADFEKSATKMGWVDVFRKMNALRTRMDFESILSTAVPTPR